MGQPLPQLPKPEFVLIPVEAPGDDRVLTVAGGRVRQRCSVSLCEEFPRQRPQAPGVVRVDGVTGDPLQGTGAAVDDVAFVAVGEVAATHAVEER